MGFSFGDFAAVWPIVAALVGLWAATWSRRSPTPATFQLLFFAVLIGLGLQVLCGIEAGSSDWSHGGLCLGVTIVGGVMGPSSGSAAPFTP